MLMVVALVGLSPAAEAQDCRHITGARQAHTFDIADCSRQMLHWVLPVPNSTLGHSTNINVLNSAASLVWWTRCSAAPWSSIPTLAALGLNGSRLTGASCNPAALVPRAVTSSDVLRAIKRIGLPSPQAGVPRYTLVNLKTTFYTHAEAFTRHFQLLGRPVTARVTPDLYTWSWGDGRHTTTDRPGKPYPSTEVTHTYVHRTHGRHWMQVNVSVRYHCDYQVSGGEWRRIAQTITIDGQVSAFPVKEATAVLVPR
jgi:hypothetical protein